MERKKTFLVVCFSILMTALSAQTRHAVPVDNFLPAHLEFKRIFVTPAAVNPSPIRTADLSTPPPTPMTSAPTLGFFCKEELVIQKTLKLPIYFRLGSLEYCNRMEGK